MEPSQRYTNSPTPPLPIRNPYRTSHWDAPLPDSYTSPDLIVRPLFSGRTTTPSFKHESLPQPTARPFSSLSSTTSSSRNSCSSFASYASSSSSSSTTAVSGPGSICRPPTSQSYAFPPPDIYDWGNEWDPAHAPTPRLRRKKSPKTATLRDLRERGSDVCLRRVCEEEVERYLSGGLFGRGRWGEGLGRVEEE